MRIDDGSVVFVPSAADAVGVWDASRLDASAFRAAPITRDGGFAVAGAAKFGDGALLPDGRVVFAPSFANVIGVFNATADSLVVLDPLDAAGGFDGAAATGDGSIVFAPSDAGAVGALRLYCALTPPANGAAGDCSARLRVHESCLQECDAGFKRLGVTACDANGASKATCATSCEWCAHLKRSFGFVTPETDPYPARGLRAWFANADLKATLSTRWKSRVGGFVGKFTKTAGAWGIQAREGFGAGAPVTAIHGTSTDAYAFPANAKGEHVLPDGEWSMCSVTRYDGENNKRILQGAGPRNLVWGHYGGGTASKGYLGLVFLCDKWITTQATSVDTQIPVGVASRDN